MFNLGFSEIIIIGALALVLIGPKQLPEVARVLGRMMKEFKQATKDLSGGLLEVKEELKRPMQEGFNAITRIEDEFQQHKSQIISDFQKAAQDAEDSYVEEITPKKPES